MAFDAVKTKANYDRLVEAEKQLNAILPDCDFAEECGIDVEGRRMTAMAIRDAITQLKSKLFPKGPPDA